MFDGPIQEKVLNSQTASILLSLIVCSLAVVLFQRLSLASLRYPPAARRVFSLLRTRPRRPAGEVLAACIGLIPFFPFLSLTARPLMASLLTLALWLLLLTVNGAKIRILREPLVLADAWLIGQIARYPEMYFPFLPLRRILFGFALLLSLLALLWLAEEPLPSLRRPTVQAILALAFLFIPALVLLMRLGRLRGLARSLLRLCPSSHDAVHDSRESGTLTASLLHPILAGLRESGQEEMPLFSPRKLSAGNWPESFVHRLDSLDTLPELSRPHVLIVQAESFCDVRRHFRGKQARALADFLPNWDRLSARGQTLPTPEGAFGAYTMRTEFSTLTGLGQSALGPWAFNPYLLAARRPLWSLARHFAERGYDSLCMHPYHKKFFRRDKVMPNLGFRRFLGLEELGSLEHFGPHVADLALGQELLARLNSSASPVFAFLITMEAHSPWSHGRLTREQVARVLPDIDRSLFREKMLLYLCHLRHMDMLFGLLLDSGDPGGQREAPLLWVYGDHAPALEECRSFGKR